VTASIPIPDRDQHRRAGGFTLIEIAVALLILTLLVSAFLVPLQAQVEQRKISETQKILDQAMEALLGFAAANGRLPCPASSTSNGAEAFAAGGNATNGNCLPDAGGYFNGFLPAATLGFSPVDASGYALDAWGSQQNRIRYAISNNTVNGVTNPFTKAGGMRLAGISNIPGANLLYVCSSSAGVTASNCGINPNTVTLTSNAPVVVWSLGSNAATGGTGADEAENLDGDRIFVWHTQTGSNAANGEFDDMVAWMSSNVLLSKMISAGQLP